MRTKHEIETAFAPRSALAAKTSFVLVGIGGAGMSGVARMLARRGHRVRGTDSTASPVTQALISEGIEVWIGHHGDIVEPGDALVLTDAIDLARSPEVAAARSLGCDLFRRSQVLGWLLEGKRTIAVTGSHGKTTTTGMIGAGLRAAGLDPTIVVGAEVPEFGGAVVEGSGEWAVVEACEAYDSLRDFDPHIAVLTNLELDHVDFHGDWEGLRQTVTRFLDRIPPEGALVYCAEDSGATEVAQLVGPSRWPYREESYIQVLQERVPDHQVMLASPAPGKHNRLNASAAMTVCDLVGVDLQSALFGIVSFRGAERRLQQLLPETLRLSGKLTEAGDAVDRVGSWLQTQRRASVVVIDDYAHHPTEIAASLQAVREKQFTLSPVLHELRGKHDPNYRGEEVGRLVVVYQPHLYSRTAPLIKEFAAALSQADVVVLTDIYPAREDPIPGVSSWRIAELVTKPCFYVPQRHLLPREVAKIVRPWDVVVGMGAGNISEFAPAFVTELEHRVPASSDQGPRPSRVAVLYGGDSAEREVSILSGREVAAALERRGFAVTSVDVSERLLSGGALAELTGTDRPDVVFLAVHGTHAEDGAVQGLLELLHLPYTGSGILASALAMDKDRAKRILAEAGLSVPSGRLVSSPTDVEALGDSGSGWVVKPNAQGSTVGLRFVERREDLAAAVAFALQFGREVLVEEWVRGVEVSVPVLGDEALPVVEIVPASGSYDFASKYTPGATEEVCPARLTPEQTALCQETALRAHRALGCRGVTRTDMIVASERTVVLEVNTLPGMTSTSLVPRSAGVAGLGFDALCERIVTDAFRQTSPS